jgi:hypothetical protein
MLLAMAKHARARYCCPDIPPAHRETWNRFPAYLGRYRPRPATGLSNAPELEQVLWLYTRAFSAGSYLDAVRSFQMPLDALAAPAFGQRVQRQLEQLGGGGDGQQEPLLTVRQLQCSCYVEMVEHAADMEPQQLQVGQTSAPTAAAVAVSSAREACLLQPDNPAAHHQEAKALFVARSGRRRAKQMMERCLRATNLARQQGSDYWTLQGLATALLTASSYPLDVGLSNFTKLWRLLSRRMTLRCTAASACCQKTGWWP